MTITLPPCTPSVCLTSAALAMAPRLSAPWRPQVYDDLVDIGADSAEQRASAILSGLQFLEEQKSWPTSAFSGEAEGAKI